MWSVHINTVFRKKESEVAIASAEIYDPEANIFTPTGAMNEAWVGHTATLLPNGQVLIVGGWGVGRRNSTAEPYDPQTGEFRLVTSMSAPQAGITATLLENGQVLIAGGESASNTPQLISAPLVLTLSFLCRDESPRWKEIGLAYIAFALNNPDHYLLMFTNVPAKTELQDMLIEGSSFPILLQAIQRGIDAGVFKARAGFGLHEMAYAAWSLVHGISMLLITYLGEFPLDFAAADRAALWAFNHGLQTG